MNRHQNRSRSRDNYSNNNRNRSRNTGNDYRRRDDYDRNSNRYQGGGGGRRVDHSNQMSQSRGAYNVNTGAAGYSQNMGMYGGGQTQMGSYGAYGTSTAFQQNRFAVSQQQMINPWANNMMPSSSMAGSGDEAKLAMNILNAVLSSSGSSPTGRGMSPPPNKMRRMDYREGGYDDRRRRPRSPPGRSHQNRQQSSQRFGSDRRGRDGHSSYQRNDDHRFRNSFSKSPGVSRSSRQSSVESSEFVFRKRLSFDERERENKKFKDLSLKALRCHMCEKSTFQSVAAYLAHVDSKGHSKVAKAFHEKIAATTTLLKQNARLALHKELTKAKAMGKKVTEKECRVCEGPMVYGILKHKNILACKILHKFQKQTSCCGKDHKNRFMIEEHCLSLAHLKVKYESEEQNEENKDGTLEESNLKDGSIEDSVEDEEEKMKRLKRDEARRKRKYGEDQTDEEEEDEEEEENQDEKQDEDADKNNEEEEEQKKNNAEQIDTNSGDKEKGEEPQEQLESNDVVKEERSEDESMETNQDKEIKDEKKDSCTTKENGHNDQTENDENDEENKEAKSEQQRNRNQNRRGGDNRSKNKNDKDDMYQGKTVKRMTMEELVEFHKISLVDDPEKLGPYDPAHPTGLNYIETHVAFHCMACIEYYPAAADDLKAHCCSKEHYDLFRCKYMKLQGVRDSPMNLKRLKKAKDNESKDGDKQTDNKEEKTKKENVAEEKEKDNKAATESEDVAGDDALYDPYEGESGDLTTMLQDKESAEEQECETLEGYEVQDEAQESEPENYEDNILDYEEDDVGEDEDKDEIKDQRETQKGNNKKNKEEKKVQDNKGEEVQDDEVEEVNDDENEEVQDDETEEVQDDETEEVQDEENEEALDDENEEVRDEENEEVQDDENEEILDEENEEVEDDENQDYQEDDENEGDDDDQEEEVEEEEEEEEEAATPAVPTRRGRSKRF